MTDQLEAPQLCEGEGGLGEAQQLIPRAARVNASIVEGAQHQLLEAPRELPEGLDVGLGSFAEDALDEKRAHPAGRDDRVPQRLPERLSLLIPLVEVPVDPKLG